MALTVDGVAYVTAAQAAREAGVTRQTLWRWRQEGKVPTGRRYRDKQVLFTRTELERILGYAHRLVQLEPPLRTEPAEQLRLFAAKKRASR